MNTLVANRIDDMAATSRVWVFQSSKEIDGKLELQLNEVLNEFIGQWAAHGQELYGGFDIRFSRFIIIAVDEQMAGATGCSIDGMMKLIQELSNQYELDLLNRMKVAYRKGEKIEECDVNEFTDRLASGESDENTIVFNNVIETVGDLNTKWEVPVKDSWQRNLLS